MGYGAFAGFYEAFTSDVDYHGRTEYLIQLFKKLDRVPSLLLDVGCGTGGFSFELARHGIDVIGVDPSPAMLSLARAKPFEGDHPPLFLEQSAETLDLYGTVDGAVACLDTLNHIVDFEELVRSLSRISLFLEPERLFIFDVNTLYKHKHLLSGKKFIYDNGDKLCIWKNSRCTKNGTVRMKLKLYENTADGYLRDTDHHAERAYTEEEWRIALDRAGFDIVALFGEQSENSPRETEEREVWVVRKRNEKN